MLRKKLIFISMAVCLITVFNLLNGKESSMYYLKVGATNPPGDSDVLPTLGIGARFQKDKYGFDLSANIGSLIFVNYASLKGIGLFYPNPEKQNQLYLGFGPGIGYFESSVPMGGPFGSASSHCGFLSVDGLVGYEFRHAPRFKTFVQLEISQPIFSFKNQRRSTYKPGFALTAGIGF